MKKCSSCKMHLSLDMFSTNGGKYLKSKCKSCYSKYIKKRRRCCKKDYLTQKYRSMKRRVDGLESNAVTSVGKPIISKKDFIKWSLENQDFHRLYESWVKSGFKMSESPSIDRVNIDGGYEIGNMQFITHLENSMKDRKKNYLFISPSNQLTAVYGLEDFCKKNNLIVSLMSMVHSGKRGHHKGWRKAAQ